MHAGDEPQPPAGGSINKNNTGAGICGLPQPPAGGCTAVVVRTGFNTTQGGLMRKILFATERVNATSSETVYFIAVLVLFAMVASAVVLKHGLVDESRNKFKLVRNHSLLIIIYTCLTLAFTLAFTLALALALTLTFTTAIALAIAAF